MTSKRSRPSPAGKGNVGALPTAVWALGMVSMLMDTSSELVHSLLPVFMATVLGASMTTIGLVEGVAEATASITKVFSGVISDYLGKRKLLAVLGYGLAAITKPVFPLATTIGWVFAARFVDRIGKGIRGAPRDALVADVTPPELRGAAYGLRQALDSVGAFLGPLLALAFMAWFANDIDAVLWIAVVPAFLAVVVLMVGVRDPEQGLAPAADSVGRGGAARHRVAGEREGGDGEWTGSRAARTSMRRSLSVADGRRLPLRYWLVVLLGAVFTLARFSEAFLVLRAQDVGLAVGYVPMVLIVMNVVYSATAYPAGVAADRLRPATSLIAGLAVLVAADLVLATGASPLPALVGTALWGLHMGLTQGLLTKLVADTAPADLVGTAFGIFNLVTGVTLLLASVIAGALWGAFGAPSAFLAGAAFAALAVLGLLTFQWRT